ncbi:MAG: undecaprenyldiphospho-muramoylpentapeptide beta-N-acetylglucosaminyltransferase [Gammaproteobacteria bacterium]|nr:undecaprenyldiphospho-muramoylpentapeptide beta-N-acetylglucosaminyltransferase [Gammaproteobacteria bacterium]
MVTVMPTRILIMAGGTGGHVFPALAVAEHLRQQGVKVSWMGTHRGLESRLVPAAGFDMEYISVNGLRGKGILSWLLAPYKLSLALFQSLQVCRRLRPQAVLGMGGFVTGPGGLAAWLLDQPLLIQEQNAIAGLTNRLLSRIANKVMSAFPGAFRSSTKVEITGNPVRDAIINMKAPEKRFAEHNGPLRLLVIGGSLGAQALNEILPYALKQIPEAQRPDVWHQTGANKQTQTKVDYEKAGIQAHIDEFIDDMAAAYSWADLVICRAGALTVSEVAAAGLGSILVPYPYAVDDHQTANANYLVNVGAAKLLPQSTMTVESLQLSLIELLDKGRDGLLAMAQSAHAAAVPESTSIVAQRCLEAAHG